jgi:ABC-type sugar transport system substrate-binding protein
MRRRTRAALLAPALLLALAASATAAHAAVVAHGSVQQAYATGLKAGARVTLVDRATAT